jgi:hypothetical protein
MTVTGPLTEEAAFYVQLALEADRGTSISYSYGSQTGTVQAGTTKTLYLPPASNVTLRASPSIFVYSFASWEGTGVSNSAKPVISLVVDSPSALVGTSAYNYPLILGAAAAVLVAILAISLLTRGRRKRESLSSISPGTASA